MITAKDLPLYQLAWDNFIQDEDEVEAAIIASTEAGADGIECSLDVFKDGTYELVWDTSDYNSRGILVAIPQLSADECYSGVSDVTIESLKNNWVISTDRIRSSD